VNDIRPENEKDLEVGVASTIVDKMKPHQVSVALYYFVFKSFCFWFYSLVLYMY
jgi:hypothetical protein